MTLKPALAIGCLTLLAGLLGLVIPPLAKLETQIGLDWLFNLRGPRPAPEKVVIVGIDRSTARTLGLPVNPRAWPRSYHARLVRRLAALNTRVIVFDMRFEEARHKEQDRQFAQAVAEAGNVILFQYLELELLTETPDMAINIQHLRRPIPELADAAVALAPFTLPRGGARIDWAWTFKSDAAGVPTIPAVALQQFALPHWDPWLSLLRSRIPHNAMQTLEQYGPGGEQPDTTELVRATRILFEGDRTLREKARWKLDRIAPEDRPIIEALIHLYTGPDKRLLDLYGPEGSLRFVSYEQVLGYGDDPLPELSQAAVFVGYTEQVQPEQIDGFYTVFTDSLGYNLNGVEIIATTFANLLERRTVEPLPAVLHLLSIAACGFAMTALFLRLSVPATLAVVPALAVGLLTVSVYLFSSGKWFPVVGLLLFQLPVALLGALLWRYSTARRERREIHKAFCFFLPEPALQELVQSLSPSDTPSKLVYAVCLATDVERYTDLAEHMAPGPLRELLNHYFQLLFAPVRNHGGTISNAVGDSMLAIWASTSPRLALHENAAQAAVEILDTVAGFNAANSDTPLPTRIGVHGGEIALGHVGAQGHFEYRPVGDIVNATSRLEGLCKQLGTYALASEEVAAGLEMTVTRPLGRFRMVGKQRAIGVHELIGPRERVDGAQQARLQAFSEALEDFQAGRFVRAAESFRAISERFPHDGPSAYFLELSERYARVPPEEAWDGVVLIHKK